MIDIKDIKLAGFDDQTNDPQTEPIPAEGAGSVTPPVEGAGQDAAAGQVDQVEKYVPSVDVPKQEYSSGFKDETIEKMVMTIVDAYEKGEDIKKVMSYLATDFNAIPDEELIKQHLREQNPGVSESGIERLYNKELSRIWPVDDEDDEDEMIIRRNKLKAEADRIRQLKEEDQKKVLTYTRPDPEQMYAEQVEQVKKQVTEWTDMVYADPVVGQIARTGKLHIEKDGHKFSYEVDSQRFIETMVVPGAFEKMFQTEDGKTDLNKWAEVVAFALNPEAYKNFLLASGKSVATGKLLDTLENPAPKNPKSDGVPTSDLTSALMSAIKNRKP